MSQFLNCKVCSSNTLTLVNKKNNLVKCSSCHLVFCSKIYSQEEFVQVYDELYNKENALYSNHSVREYNMLVKNKNIKVGYHRSKILKKHVFNETCNSVLEIGSGVGLIGVYIRNKKATINYLGIEIDEESFNKSQTLKLNTINQDFTFIENIEESFDVIMLWEVIEHLQDLSLFLKLAYEKLNVGGKIILSTPNYNKIYNYPEREKDEIFQDQPPVHLNFFTQKNILNVFEKHQFTNVIVTVKKFPYVQVGKKKFYIDFLKAIFSNYYGSTIYLVAKKE